MIYVFDILYLIIFKIFKNFPFGSVGSSIRVFCLRHLIPECGENIFIGTGITFVHLENLYLKSNISIRENCYIDCSAKVTIGNDVSIAHGVSIISFNHSYNGPKKIRENELVKMPITIEDDCWIGCKSILLAGITIKKRTIVAAGGVVTRTCDGESIIGGVPAKMIKKI